MELERDAIDQRSLVGVDCGARVGVRHTVIDQQTFSLQKISASTSPAIRLGLVAVTVRDWIRTALALVSHVARHRHGCPFSCVRDPWFELVK